LGGEPHRVRLVKPCCRACHASRGRCGGRCRPVSRTLRSATAVTVGRIALRWVRLGGPETNMQPTANGREGPGSIPSDAKLGLQLAVLKSRLGEVERTNVALEREVD